AVLVLPGLATVCRLHMRAEMHARRIPPAEERLVGVLVAGDEILGARQSFFVDRLHPLFGQRAGVFDPLSAFAIGLGTNDAARTEPLQKLRILRIVLVLRLLGRVQVVEAAEIFVEAVHGRQVLVAIAKMIFAELASGIALVLEQRGDSGIALLPA